MLSYQHIILEQLEKQVLVKHGISDGARVVKMLSDRGGRPVDWWWPNSDALEASHPGLKVWQSLSFFVTPPLNIVSSISHVF